MASEDELIALRKCEREDCEYRIPNGVKDLKDILMAMANHLAAIHPASGGSERGYSSRGTGSRRIQIQEDSDSQCCVYGG